MSETEKAILQEAAIFATNSCAPIPPEVLRQLKGCRHFAFVGTGSSHHVAEWASVFSKETTPDCPPFWSTWEALHNLGLNKAIQSPSTLVLVISHRGYSGLTKIYLDRLVKRHSRILLLCGEGAPTGGFAHLYVSPRESSKAHTMSLLGAMGAIVGLILRSKTTTKGLAEQARRTAKVLELVTQELEVKSFLQKKTRLHVVGGGPFHAVAREIALKAQEMAHIPALSHEIESILHGPLTAVEENDAVLLLPARTAKYPFLYVSRMNAVRRAADQVGALVVEPRFPSEVISDLKKLPLSLQALVTLAWGQKLALSHALSHRINPDSNRYENARYAKAAQAASL